LHLSEFSAQPTKWLDDWGSQAQRQSYFLNMSETPLEYRRNEALETILTQFSGNPYDGLQFHNLTPRHQPRIRDLLNWSLHRGEARAARKADPERPALVPWDASNPAFQNGVTWLGHASLLLQTPGLRILIDPVERYPFMNRLVPPHTPWNEVLSPDFLLVSHGHFDHLDARLIKRIDAERSQALVPLNLGQWITKANPALAIQEAGWFQKFALQRSDVEIVLLPAQHWHRRGFNDMNRMLWGSFWIRMGGKTIYFAGDTAYGPHFRQIRDVMGAPDIAILPIGAYQPDFIMKESHMNPGEAVQASNDLGAKVMIPCHWGTFALSDEPPGEPIRKLRELVKQGKVKAQVQELGICGSYGF